MNQPRFNPDGQCFQTALDFIFTYFDDTHSQEDIIKCTSGGYKTLFQFLTEKGYSFIFSVPLGSLFFVNYWVLFFKFPKHFVLPPKYERDKERLSSTNKKYVILGEDSAKRLYGLTGEYWSHFIVFYRNAKDNTLEIYDPLKSLLEKELGRAVLESCTPGSLLIKLLIWKGVPDRVVEV